MPAFEKNNIAIAFAANDFFVPYMATMIYSVVVNGSEGNNYDIVILTSDISAENQQTLAKMINPFANVSLRVVNVEEYVAGYKFFTANKENFSQEAYYRLLIPEVMSEYEKVLYFDGDMVALVDVAELYQTDLRDCLLASSRDLCGLMGYYNPLEKRKAYRDNVLKLKRPDDYFITGMLLFNITAFRQAYSTDFLLEYAASRDWLQHDQDILNVLCQGRVAYLDLKWNHIFDCYGERIKNVIVWDPVPLYEAYMEAKKDPYIIHYAGFCKPWDEPSEEFGEVFWEYARRTPYYEVLVQRLAKHMADNAVHDNHKKHHISLKSRIIYFFLPDGSARRDKAREMWYKVFGRPKK